MALLRQGFFGAVLLLTLVGEIAADERCDRDCVVGEVDAYVAALVAHDPGQVELAEDVRSTQNGEVIEPGEGVWQTISRRGAYQQIVVDSKLDSAVFFGAFEEDSEPMLLAIRFAIEQGEITELEHLVARPDERNRLIRRHQLTEPNPVFDTVLPESQRRDRAVLKEAADAYLDGIANSTGEGVPMHPECIRRENGVTLLRNPNPETEPCPVGFHRFNYITDVRDRRVAAVDEERGLVLVFAFFDVPGDVEVAPGPWGPSDLPDNEGTENDGEPRVDSRKIPRSLYIAELFRVVDGKIRDIEATMHNLDLGTTAGW